MRRIALLPLLLAGCAVPASGPAADIELTSFALSDNSVQVSQAPGTITCSMGIQETGAPGNNILNAVCAFRSPSGSVTACVSGSPSSGTVKNGTWECSLRFRQNAEAGEWQFAYIQINNDEIPSRSAYVTKADLNTSEPTWPDLIDVTSVNADSEKPSVTAFTRTPASLLNGDLPQQLECSITATDNTGVFSAGCTFAPPTGTADAPKKQVTCTAREAVDDTWSCNAEVKALSGDEVGTWNIVNIFAVDAVGNLQNLGPNAISGIGGPTSFAVNSGTTPVCGNNIKEGSEECDGTDDTACEGLCQTDCTCGAAQQVCGNNTTEGTEECDGTDDTACPGECLVNCTCPIVCSPGATQLTADSTGGGDVYTNSAAQSAASDSLTFSAYVKTSQPQAILEIADQSISAHGDAAALVRFNYDGVSSRFIDVRNGASYTSDSTFNWNLDTWYKITVTANVTAETYTVQIGECDESQTTVATNYAFRNQGTNGSLTHYAIWKSGSGEVSSVGVAELTGASWSEVCNPLTCDDYGYTCGTGFGDGCGGTINCNAPTGTCTGGCADCSNPDVCVTGSCCTPSTTVCTDPTPDYECGDWPDGCGGTVNCDTGGQTCTQRVSGEVCDATGQCVPPSEFPTKSTTGVASSYWCPRWDTLHTTGTGLRGVSANQVVEYEHRTNGGGYDINGNSPTIRCVKATGSFNVKAYMNAPYNYGALFENFHGEAIVPSTGGRCGDGGRSGFTWNRVACYPVYKDVIQNVSGLIVDSYLDINDVADTTPNAHSDGIQMADGCGPFWAVGNRFVGNGGRLVPDGPRDCTQGNLLGLPYCSHAHLFLKGRWTGSPCRRMPSSVVANNWIGGALVPDQWENSSGRIINAGYYSNVYDSGMWYYTPCEHRWADAGYTIVTDPDPAPGTGEVCVEHDFLNTQTDDDQAEITAKCQYDPADGILSKGSCVDLEPIPVMTMSAPTLSATSCTAGNQDCNDITITVTSASTNEPARAKATSINSPSGDLWYEASPGPSFRWRYSCGGSSSNIMDDPDPAGGNESQTPCTRGHCLGGYQDNAADLWYDYPPCNGTVGSQTGSCTFTNVCDFQAEGAGDYTIKVYVEAGPGAAFRPSTHQEVTFSAL